MVKMPLKRFRILVQPDFVALRDGGVFTLGTTSEPVARNLLKNYKTLISERGEHAAFLGYGVIEMVIAAASDSTAKEGLLPVCLKRAALVNVGDLIKVRVDDEAEWQLNPLLSLHLPELSGRDFSQQARTPETFVTWLRAQLGNRVRALRAEGFVGLFSSQQMVIQGRFKDSRLRQALARNPAIKAKLDGTQEEQLPADETTDDGIEDLGMVLPCDDSQLRIVQRANFGSSLIVEGPPGHG